MPVAEQPKPASAWVADEDGGKELAELLNGAGVKAQLGGAPGSHPVCFVTPLGEDCSGAAVRLKLDPAKTVAVDMLGRFQGRRTLMKNPLTDAAKCSAPPMPRSPPPTRPSP